MNNSYKDVFRGVENRKTSPNQMYKNNLIKLLEFLGKEESLQMLKENQFEELYSAADLAGLNEYELTRIFREFRIETLPYVTKIRCGMFFGYDGKEIRIPYNIKAIDAESICGLKNLKSVTISTGVTYIGNHAFAGNTSLTEIHFRGRAAVWERINKDERWADNSSIEQVICSCGEVIYIDAKRG